MDRVGLLVEGLRGRHMDKDIEVRCFGKFDIIKDGQPIFFKYNKAKELFAVLVDARGGMVSMEYAITLLWEDREYDSRVKGLYRKAVSMMRAAFRDAGCEDLCLYYRSSLAANIRAFYCDYYEYMKGDAEMRRSFFDNYMTDYSWAEETNAMLHNMR